MKLRKNDIIDAEIIDITNLGFGVCMQDKRKSGESSPDFHALSSRTCFPLVPSGLI